MFQIQKEAVHGLYQVQGRDYDDEENKAAL